MFRPTQIATAAAALVVATVTMSCHSTHAWVSNSAPRTRTTTLLLHAVSTRQEFFQTIATGLVVASTAAATTAGVVALPLPAMAADGGVTTLPNGVSYVVKKAGTGPKGTIGELVAIRFAAYVNGNKLDDLFDNPEPYYTRLGSGGLLKGVEETLPLMQLGDRWVLTIPSKLAFGPNGRPSSPGKPRIPGDAAVEFDVEMVGLPGKEQELIELIGD